MADFFLEPDDGLPVRPPLEQREDEDDDIFALAEMSITEIRRNTDQLATGDVSVTAWYDQMVDLLSAYHLAGWYIGAGGEDEPTDAQFDILAEAVATQLEYLDGFRDALTDEPNGTTLSEAYRNRAEMYGRATGQSVWIGKTRVVKLPAYPRDGRSTECGSWCACEWGLTLLEGDGNVDAVWRLGSTDHCPQCLNRSRDWNPFQVRSFEWVGDQLSADHFR